MKIYYFFSLVAAVLSHNSWANEYKVFHQDLPDSIQEVLIMTAIPNPKIEIRHSAEGYVVETHLASTDSGARNRHEDFDTFAGHSMSRFLSESTALLGINTNGAYVGDYDCVADGREYQGTCLERIVIKVPSGHHIPNVKVVPPSTEYFQ